MSSLSDRKRLTLTELVTFYSVFRAAGLAFGMNTMIVTVSILYYVFVPGIAAGLFTSVFSWMPIAWTFYRSPTILLAFLILYSLSLTGEIACGIYLIVTDVPYVGIPILIAGLLSSLYAVFIGILLRRVSSPLHPFNTQSTVAPR